MSVDGTPCETCAHLARVFDNGRVMYRVRQEWHLEKALRVLTATAGMEGGMGQSIEEVDRISWEADMMLAEEHFDAMDEDAYEDGDYAGEGMKEDAE